MRILAKLKGKYCSWCEAENCKKNKVRCYKYSKRLLNKKIRQKNRRVCKSE